MMMMMVEYLSIFVTLLPIVLIALAGTLWCGSIWRAGVRNLACVLFSSSCRNNVSSNDSIKDEGSTVKEYLDRMWVLVSGDTLLRDIQRIVTEPIIVLAQQAQPTPD